MTYALFIARDLDGDLLPDVMRSLTSGDSVALTTPSAALPNYGAYNTYKPAADTSAPKVGIPPGTVLTPYYGDLYLTQPGQVYDRLDVFGRIINQTWGCLVSRTRVRGLQTAYTGSLTANSGIIDSNSGSASSGPDGNSPTVFTDCEISNAAYPDVAHNGFFGHDFKAVRCDVHDVVDTFGVQRAGSGKLGVTIDRSWAHDLSQISPDPNHLVAGQPEHTHNDNAQVHLGDGLVIIGNNFQCLRSLTTSNLSTSYNPSVTGNCIGITQDGGAVTNMLIDGNWLDGGAQTITAILGKGGASNLGTITNNHFGRHAPTITKSWDTTGAKQRVILIDSAHTVTLSNNTFEDDGTPVPIYRVAGAS